jgi:hypothetical protein
LKSPKNAYFCRSKHYFTTPIRKRIHVRWPKIKHELLSSQVPEVVLVAILSNYPKEEAENVLRRIVFTLKSLIKNKRVLKIYINQLMMLSRLRKIEALTIKITEEMPIHYDIETDALYLRGTEKGIEVHTYMSVMNLLADTDFDDAKIARIVKTTLDFVQKVRNERPLFDSVSSLVLDTKFNNDKIARLLNVAPSFVQTVRAVLAQ